MLNEMASCFIELWLHVLKLFTSKCDEKHIYPKELGDTYPIFQDVLLRAQHDLDEPALGSRWVQRRVVHLAGAERLRRQPRLHLRPRNLRRRGVNHGRRVAERLRTTLYHEFPHKTYTTFL